MESMSNLSTAPVEPGGASHHKQDGAHPNIAYTLTACVRCRHRKTRCDAGLPRCGPCERTNKLCEYFDIGKGRNMPRTYVIYLQNKIQEMEAELARVERDRRFSLDAEVMMRSAGLVRFKEHDDSRFLGASSGIAMTRLVMELAKQNTESRTIKEIVPDIKAKQIKDHSEKESSKPTSKVYPLISDVAAPHLPTKDLTRRLVEVFNRTAQYLLPTLHEPSFDHVVDNVYHGSTDAYENFTVRLVIAISMQKLDTFYAGLADSYYLAALPYLERAVQSMDLRTLQCFALIAQYSMVTPTRTASYWVVGLATRLCQELGITEEAGIVRQDGSTQLDAIQIDMRRRLFWIITSMEFGLAHGLGRPSGFGTSPNRIDVQFFEAVDDCFITKNGVVPGSPVSRKKQIAIHFFRMRLHQAEIRRTLYLKKRPDPQDDQDSWFRSMDERLKEWLASCPKDDEGSGLSETWFKVRYNTMIIFLHRPSPQLPEPSSSAARKCIEAALCNIQLQREQMVNRSVDVTWIFTQMLFMHLNTVLWALSYPDVRKVKPRDEIQQYVQMAKDGIRLASERWPGVESALELYENLVNSCLKAYDGNRSYVIRSPSHKRVARSHGLLTPPPVCSPSDVTSSVASNGDLRTARPATLGVRDSDHPSNRRHSRSPAPATHRLAESSHPDLYSSQPSQYPHSHDTTTYHSTEFDPNSMYNSLPAAIPNAHSWDLDFTALARVWPIDPYIVPHEDHEPYLDAIGDQYSQYLHAPYVPQHPLQSLNEEQQVELMTSLEKTGPTMMSHVNQIMPIVERSYEY